MKMKARSRRKGIAIIWVVVVAFVVIGFVGFAIDIGYGVLVAHQLQNAADAAALAGCRYVRGSAGEVRQAAINIAGENSVDGLSFQLDNNPGNAPDGEIVIGYYNMTTREFTPGLYSPSPNAVKVVARRTDDSLGGPLGLFFAPVFGVSTVNVAREAIARIGGSTGSGLIILNEEEKWTFRLSGTVILDVRDSRSADGGGTIQVNSNYPHDALKTDGQPTLAASAINVVALEVDDPPEFDGDVYTGVDVLVDPLKDLPPPEDWGVTQTTPTDPIEDGIHTLSPGYYPEGIAMTDGEVTLLPGIYVVDGDGLKVTGGDLIAVGVMFYIVDTTPDDNNPSGIMLTGNGSITVTGLAGEGDYAGLAIWQAAGNDASADIRGTDQFAGIDGTLYVPDGHVDLTGTSDSFGIRQVIVDTIEISGTGTLLVDYDGRFPAPGHKIFLVR